MSQPIAEVEQEALAALDSAKDAESLQQWKSKYLGNKGAVRALLSQIGGLPTEERAGFGQGVNALKDRLTELFEDRENALKAQAIANDLEEGQIDITLPGRSRQVGGLHPVTMMHRQFHKIWADMGFQVFRSREVEEDDINFTMLNMPPHHPARDMQDTFYTDQDGVILRTHTSPGQIHAMRTLGENGTKAIRVILPGMVYRNEQITARSEAQFTQVEGLAIGRNIRMSDLKGTITEFARRIYGENVQVRYRASYFPFTEPSVEVDVDCILCGGAGCRICKYTGWLEILGAGMVHPVVLRNGGYDPAIYSGFAFGMGIERQAMLKRGVDDIRLFYSNDVRFLERV